MPAVDLHLVTEHGGHRLLVSSGDLRFETPPVEHLAFYVGVGTLAGLEVIDWPIALLLMAGHVLLDATRRPALHELGEALEEV